MSSNEGDAGSAGSELIDFVLYMFVLGPAVEWCLKSPRVNKGRPARWTGITLAVLLLAAIAGFKLSYEFIGRQPNHFETLGVTVDARSSDIKAAYRQISLKYHPDKNPDDKSAAEKFIKYQAAYEVLKDASKRETYNKFGQPGLDDKSGSSSDASTQLWSMSLFYIIWLVVGYLLTMGKASEEGRTWAFSGLLTLAVFEYQTKILSIDYLAPLFPNSTVYEKIELLHKLFPPFMHGARMISQVIYMDVNAVNKLRIEEMHAKTDELFRLLSVISGRAVIAKPGAEGGAAAAAAAVPGNVDGSITGSGSSGAAEVAADTAERLQSKGQLPTVNSPSAPGAGGGAAGAAGGAPATAGAKAATAAIAELSPEAQAIAVAATVEEAAQQQRSKDRMQNVAVFFMAYAAFKYVCDNELL